MILGPRSALRLWLLVCVVLSASACAPQPMRVTREPQTLRLVAAASCESSAQRAADAYEASRPWVTTEVQVFNTSVAEEVLREGSADVALLSWLWDGVEEPDTPLWTEGFGRDGVAVIVHPESSIAEVGLVELREIFQGRLQEWDGMTLTVISREGGSGTRAAFESMVLGGESPTLNAVVVPSSDSMIEYVASTPGAIGYVATERVSGDVRILPVEGVLPTEQTIADGRYPLWRQLYLATRGEPTGEAREFCQWLLRGGTRILSAVTSRRRPAVAREEPDPGGA